MSVNSKLTAIANAIRAKTGQTGPLTLDAMAEAIAGIPVFAASIPVTYPVGAVCTCSSGSTVLTAPDTSGLYTFAVPYAGDWTVKAVQGGNSDSKVISVTEAKAYHVTLSFREYLIENGVKACTFVLAGLLEEQGTGFIRFYGGGTGYHEAFAENVDLTKYDHLTVEGTFETTDQHTADIVFAVWKNTDTPSYENAVAKEALINGEGAVTIDISALSGPYRVGLASVYKNSHKISNLYLS